MEVIITTHDSTPHIESLHKSNPGIRIHIAREDAGWKNCDRIIRNWWLHNHHKVQSSHVCVMEYDVLVNKQLPEPTDKIHVARIRSLQGDRDWQWWDDIMPYCIKEDMHGLRPYGITPYGIFMCPREALDKICNSKWNDLYSRSIISEVRTPSVWHHEGFEFHQEKAFALCSWRSFIVNCNKEGIFHPVK